LKIEVSNLKSIIKRGEPYINTKKIAVKVYGSKNIFFISGVYWASHEHGTIVEKSYIFVYFRVPLELYEVVKALELPRTYSKTLSGTEVA
jgi:hypothetical protein